MEKKEVYLFTGALGAGKTTLINQCLNEFKKPVAIIENEIGDINIDQEAFKSSKDFNELLIEMNNGCLCCSIRGDLVVSLRKLLDREEDFKTLVIELTGMGDPGPVKETFLADPVLKENFLLKGVITVIDTVHFNKQLEEKDEEYLQTLKSQLIFSDAFFLSKLSGENESLKSTLRSYNQFAGIYTDLKFLQIEMTSDHEMPMMMKGHSHHHTEIEPISIQFSGTINHSLLEVYLSTLVTRYRGSLYRGKGVIVIKGQTHKVLFQNVYETFDFSIGPAWDEKDEEKRLNQFVFIGKSLNRELIEKGLRQCLHSIEQQSY